MRPVHLSVTALSAAALLLSATPATAAPRAEGTTDRVAAAGASADGFETPLVPAPYTFTDYLGGQPMGPWTVGGDSVDLTNDRLWDAAEGHQSLDLNGSTSGSVSRKISTLPLTSYIVSFKLAGNPEWLPALKTGELRVNGSPLKTFSFDITGHGRRSMGYVQQTAVFTTLLNTSVTLTFVSTNPGYGGPVIDDVKIQSCLLVLCPPHH
ncbi:DUF642 domain-containing protein [Streptomyces sp. NPDC058405]|uniref:DUF642 domain-containing protein n=1 Tax=Streptomyces sp. NPDC058405 TaxID=3346482 RepID=UPI003651A24A